MWRPDLSVAQFNETAGRARRRPTAAVLAGIGAVLVCITLLVLTAIGGVLRILEDGFYGPNACNDSGGNPYIEDALIKQLPPGTLRGYSSTGVDCDDRRTGSVAAGWGKGIRPATVVDLLVSKGWKRTDPADGVPQWYAEKEVAPDPFPTCLWNRAGQGFEQDEYATWRCGNPPRTQIVLESFREPRVFVARLNALGLSVDAAHQRDEDSVREIRTAAVKDPYE